MPEWMLRLLAGGIYYDADKEGLGGGDDPKDPKDPPKTPADPVDDDDDDDDDDGFDAKKAQAQIKRLRKENQRYRTAAKSLRTDIDELKSNQKTAIETAVAEALGTAKTASETAATTAVTASEEKLNKRLIRAEQKKALEGAGCVDIETGLKIIDASGISVNDDGEVVGIAEAITKLKEAKGFLFKAASTTSTFGKPTPALPKGFDAKTASKDEIAAQAAALGIGGALR